MRLKVGDKVKIIKYNVHFNGVIVKIDPTMSANGKRVISHWFHIKYLDTVDYFCVKDDIGLFVKSDLIKLGKDT